MRRNRTLLSTLISAALLLPACEERPPDPAGAPPPTPQAPATPAAPAAPAAAAADDAEAARRLFDESVKRQLAGDALGAHEALIELAARHPGTRHGRAASRRLGSSVGAVAAIGVLSAIAVPAFMKYVRRSKTSEAVINVRRMAEGAVTFYHAERLDPETGAVLPRRFPQGTPVTPARTACRNGESVKIMPAPERWGAPGFVELGFSVEEPHFYQYEFISTGEGEDATFTARAIGDLNCDGVLSTFERTGRVVDGQVELTPLYLENELE